MKPGDGLLPAERGTRYFFGKPYHWCRCNKTDAVDLHLVPGKSLEDAVMEAVSL